MDEFDLIARYFKPLELPAPELILGIGDDAAVLSSTVATTWAVTVDTLVAGVHFPRAIPPRAIGHRLAAVNLSDLAAMGARPRFATLALTLPAADPEWLSAFANGLGAALGDAGVSLIGGDTTRGPLCVTLQLMGTLDGPALTRAGARAGDLILVSGTLGDAAAGLGRMLDGAAPSDPLVHRFLYPHARSALGVALRPLAHAAVDVSDGLLADLGHIAQASGAGARLMLGQLPLSADLRAHGALSAALDFALAGGDDYELVLCVPPGALPAAHAAAEGCGVTLTAVGEIVAGQGLSCIDEAGRPVAVEKRGYRHFR